MLNVVTCMKITWKTHSQSSNIKTRKKLFKKKIIFFSHLFKILDSIKYVYKISGQYLEQNKSYEKKTRISLFFIFSENTYFLRFLCDILSKNDPIWTFYESFKSGSHSLQADILNCYIIFSDPWGHFRVMVGVNFLDLVGQ